MDMELDEAIAHAREVAEEKRNDYERACALNVPSEGFCECAAEHEQLAEWLTELQERREADRWIPVKARELTDKEKEENPDCRFVWDCPLPDDSQDVLITTCWGDVKICTFCVDFNGSYFDEMDEDEVLAWMPLPKPYESEGE
jgi:hypothetical protein